MRRLRASLVLAAGLALALSTTAGAAAPAGGGQNADSTYTGSNVDTSSALVQLNGDPLSTYVKTTPAHGKKIDFNANTVKSYRAQLSALRNQFKQWLQANAPKAKITGSWDLSLNAVSVQLNGTKLSLLTTAPQVKHVEYEGLYHPDPAPIDPDLAIISAQAAWAHVGGVANAGAGVKVAIIDTGIDITHPCFSDSGYAPQTQLGDTTFTNNKVIVAKVFNNKSPSMHYTPEAIQEHGTHVAGTVACDYNTAATVDGVAIPYGISGVAPKALLGNYNIFPGNVTNARSEDILNALDAAYMDGFDIDNMSLGGGSHGIQDLLTIAVDNLDEANMLSAVAAGNSGPGHYTVESPGSAARALTAGASTVGHFIGTTLTTGGNSYALAIGDFAVVSSDLTATIGIVSGSIGGLGDACSALPASSLTGEIAVLSRGACSFSTKIRNAQNAGAVAVVVVNNVAGAPIAMGQDGTANQPTIPAYQAGLSDRSALVAANGSSGTISATLQYVFNPAWNNFMAGFSSQGPTDVDFRVKPDVVAPGVNVLSSIPHQFCDAPPCFAFFQGTSMATPHLAGTAAVLMGAHPTWDAWQIRSAIVQNADQGVLQKSTGGIATDPNLIGSGLDDVDAALNAQLLFNPVSVSFGAVPSGSGQTLSYAVWVQNVSGTSQTFTFSVSASSGSGVSYSVTPSLTLANGAGDWIWVTMSADKGSSAGDHNAKLRAFDGSAVEVAHAAVYTLVK